eukprot:snap_masked-scaffold_5-processed-gene-13.40-mRNA-1 protein AED:1.00 eAED:1.00 QI:0/0/0/0/1/1/2/0/88
MRLPQKSIDQSVRYFLHAHDLCFADIYSETGDMFQFCKLLDKIYYLEVIFIFVTNYYVSLSQFSIVISDLIQNDKYRFPRKQLKKMEF